MLIKERIKSGIVDKRLTIRSIESGTPSRILPI